MDYPHFLERIEYYNNPEEFMKNGPGECVVDVEAIIEEEMKANQELIERSREKNNNKAPIE